LEPAVVWLVSPKEGAFFFEQALGSMDPLVWTQESLTLLPGQYEAAASAVTTPGSEIRAPDLVIFNGWTPDPLPATGRFMVVNTCPPELGVIAADPVAAPAIHVAPRPHALMQHVSLQGSRLANAHRLTLSQPARVLAHTQDNDPLIALFDSPGRQVLLLAFNVLDSDMPFRNAFPLLLRNTVSYMHEDAPRWLRPAYALGEVIRPLRPIPDGAQPVNLRVLRGKESREVPLDTAGRTFAFRDTARAGAVRLDVGDDTSFSVINIGDASESRIEPVSLTADSQSAAAKLGLSRRFLGGMPWTMFALVAALGVLMEWLTYHFRWTE
jgi:hypothetical protein